MNKREQGQILVNQCKEAYNNHDLCMAGKLWEDLHELLIDTDIAILFEMTNQFVDKEVYDICDYLKEKAYRQMEIANIYNKIDNCISFVSIDPSLFALDEFCDFYDWGIQEKDGKYNIIDLQCGCEERLEEYVSFKDIVREVLDRATDYLSMEEYGDSEIGDFDISEDYFTHFIDTAEWYEEISMKYFNEHCLDTFINEVIEDRQKYYYNEVTENKTERGE